HRGAERVRRERVLRARGDRRVRGAFVAAAGQHDDGEVRESLAQVPHGLDTGAFVALEVDERGVVEVASEQIDGERGGSRVVDAHGTDSGGIHQIGEPDRIGMRGFDRQEMNTMRHRATVASNRRARLAGVRRTHLNDACGSRRRPIRGRVGGVRSSDGDRQRTGSRSSRSIASARSRHVAARGSYGLDESAGAARGTLSPRAFGRIPVGHDEADNRACLSLGGGDAGATVFCGAASGRTCAMRTVGACRCGDAAAMTDRPAALGPVNTIG
ncbi:MAG TPA: hypothetical protein VGC55_08095, partial [Dokdonella sp.]